MTRIMVETVLAAMTQLIVEMMVGAMVTMRVVDAAAVAVAAAILNTYLLCSVFALPIHHWIG